METSLPEPRTQPPLPRDLESNGQISFRHPGYYGPTNTLLTLAKSDCVVREGTVVYGLHHKTALLACQIIANNAFDSGYFAKDSAGVDRANVPLDGLLTGHEYYFFIAGSGLLFIYSFRAVAYANLLSGQYPVVPSFRDWVFPYDDVDNIWPTTPEGEIGSQSCCSLSGNTYAINDAHIVPREEATWYGKNGMYNLADIDDIRNIIPLRKDLHKCFDDRWFVIVPKPAPSGIHYVSHILDSSATEIWPHYHNIEVRCQPTAATKKFLLTRFAWAVIQGVKPFLTAGIRRKIIQVLADEEGAINRKEKSLDGSELQASYAGGGSKSATHLKRKNLKTSEYDDLEELSSDDDSNVDADSFWDSVTRRSRKQ